MEPAQFIWRPSASLSAVPAPLADGVLAAEPMRMHCSARVHGGHRWETDTVWFCRLGDGRLADQTEALFGR